VPGADVVFMIERTSSALVDSSTSCVEAIGTTTDADGHFSFPDARASDHVTIAVYKTGYAYATNPPQLAFDVGNKIIELERTDDPEKVIRHIDWAWRTSVCSGGGERTGPLIPFYSKMIMDLEPVAKTEADRKLLRRLKEWRDAYQSTQGG
jgi:hypothetical protein